ncbi:MAG: hypothetical protein GYB67_08285 [Chloroflexi bacterium]|nr:hypothetical protein [Chloroflexota bacterium]
MMNLMIDGAVRHFIPIKEFRADHGLPPTFSMAHFEPKDFTGLGSIDRAGAELNQLRAAVLAAVPDRLALAGWLEALPQLHATFRGQLYAINAVVQLHESEIDFAAAGFGDVTQAYVYALIRANAAKDPPPSFAVVYGVWLNSTARVSQTIYEYTHQGSVWRVQLVTHAYGRAGMIVAMAESAAVYVHDVTLGCPAEGFMAGLLAEVAARIQASITAAG